MKGLSFPIKMNSTGRLNTLSGPDRVAASMSLLFSQDRGDRPYNPTNGVNLYRYVFEDVGPLEAANVRRDIMLSVSRHEQRVTLLDVMTGIRADGSTRVFEVMPVWSFDGKQYAGLYSKVIE